MQIIKKEDIKDIYYLSPMQEGMLFHYLLDRESTAYLEQFVFRLQSSLNIDLLNKSFNLLLERYDIFRTAFIYEKVKRPVQAVLKKRASQVFFQEIDEMEESEKECFIENFILQDQKRVFNLTKDVLMRISVLKAGPEDHLLVWSFHHILMDGWCMSIIMREFIQIYQSLIENDKLVLDPVYPYNQYIAWLEKQDRESAVDYWKKYLQGYTEATGIPAMGKRDNLGQYKQENFVFTLDEEITRKMEQLAAEQQVTVNILFQTIWGILLQKYNDVNDVVFGAVISGRPSEIPGIEKIVGLFINTIPVRIQSREDDTFRSLIKLIQAKALESDRHSYITLSEIQAGSELRMNLFDHIVAFENYPVDRVVSESDEGQDMAISGVSVFEQTNYDLNVIVVMGRTLEVTFNYNLLRYQREFMEQISRHFRWIAEAVLKNPSIGVSDLELNSRFEGDRIIKAFNPGKSDFNLNKPIQQYFTEQVEKTPDSTVLIFRGNRMTYRELNDKANSLAHNLIRRGVKPGNFIAVMTEPCFEMIIGVLGVLKSGAAYVPIDPSYPVDRICYIIEDSAAVILLTQSIFSEKMTISQDTLYLDREENFNFSSENPVVKYSPEDHVYGIYTSGSTGTPKGVIIQNRSLVNLCLWHNEAFSVTEKDRATKYAGFGFDASVWEIFPYIITGASLLILPDELKTDVKALNACYKEQGVTISFLPTQFCELFMEEDNPSLRILLTGGDKLKRFRKQHYDLYNNYGPTENTVVTTSYLCREMEAANIPIGKPVSNTEVLILDRSRHIQPPGAFGELYIAGEGLATGYLNNPELTQEKFMDHPWQLGKKIYRTGDKARWLMDGNIEFAGRIDLQVKIRGFRIELGEIENTLVMLSGVREAVVQKKEDPTGEAFLCAYVVIDENISIEELKEKLSKKLPGYMVPAYFMKLPGLPVNANGKVDRKALPELEVENLSRVLYTAPSTAMELTLSRIWESVLGINKIGIHDNFFELGGHSLKATVVASRIYKELNVELALREIFESPTIHSLAQAIKRTEEGIFTDIEPAPQCDYYPVSSAQKRLYVIDRMEGPNTGYNIPNILILEEELDPGLFITTFRKLVDRHEAFRTSFFMKGKEVFQEIHETVDFEPGYREIDEKKLPDFINDFIRPFDLSKAPLLRVELLKLGQCKYALCFDMHHIISDEASMKILMREFIQILGDETLPDLRIQYKDFAYRQNKLLDDRMIQKQKEYWLKNLSGEIPVLNLPTDFSRPQLQNFEGSTHRVELPAELSYKISQIAGENGATLFMFLLAAFNLLLSRYGGQEDIIIGTPVAGRPHADLENIIGMFVNTLALRNFPVWEKSFKEFLKEIRENSLRAFENQDYQFEELVEQLGLRRDLSRSPLFDVMFVMQNEDALESRDTLRINQAEFSTQVSKFDLSLFASGNEQGLSFTFEYCTKLFKFSTIERMSRHWINLLGALAENPDVKLGEAEYLSEEEKRKILLEFNQTEAAYPKEMTIHRLFMDQAKKTPDQTALVYRDIKITYKEVDERTDRIASCLKANGIESGSVVGVFMERSPAMVIGIIAILKAGGAYLPLDLEYPGDRIDFMLSDSGATILLTQKHLAGKIGFERIIEIEEAEEFDSSVESEWENDPSNLAYLIYTSGSTGVPKGVMISHQSVVNILSALQSYYPLGKEDTYLLKTTYTFDVSVAELFGWFMDGGRLAILEQGGEKNSQAIVRAIKTYGVTHINFVPSMLKVLMDTLTPEELKILGNLRYLFTAGEALPVNLWKRFHRAVKNVKFENIYGPTELTIYATKFSLGDPEGYTLTPIGKPVQNTRAYILDRRGCLTPIGIPGELCISGEGLAMGYLNRTELTDSKFVPNPFEAGKKMYKTGDLVRWLSDGNIEYLGRIDHQVKIRGFRIELGEIESKLLQVEGLRDSVVIDREDSFGNKYLCAYYTGEETLDSSDLKEHLIKELPEYMVPSYFVHLEVMPLNNNGKIDRKALPEPDRNREKDRDYAEPGSETEKKLAEIWKEVLDIEKPGINDDFFEYGGHSLSAIHISALVRKLFQVEMPVSEVFSHTTIARMAKFIEQSGTIGYRSIMPAEKKELYPLSSAQLRLFLLDKMLGPNIIYNIPAVYSVDSGLDRERLHEAFQKLVERHETLRTSIVMKDDKAFQKIHNHVHLPMEYFKCTNEEASAVISKFVRPFDLSEAPLIRVGYIETGESTGIFLFDMHHIISDGVSMGILAKEVFQYYNGIKLAPLGIQYKDFSQWQNGLLESGQMQKQEDYWMEKFQGDIPMINLPLDFPRPKVQSMEGDRVFEVIDEELSRKFLDLISETGTTFYILVLAVLNVLLSKYSGQEDIIIGSPISGRPHSDLEGIIGMFVNTLAMRNEPRADKSFRWFLAEVKENALKAYENQDYQFEKLVDKLSIPRNMGRNPLFDVMLAVETAENSQSGDEAKGEVSQFEPLEINYSVSKFDLSFNLAPIANGIRLQVEYCTKLFQKETARCLITHFQQIMKAVVLNPDILIKEIDMLISPEKKEILEKFNNTRTNYPADRTLVELFEEQVKKHPDDIALIFENAPITYSELNRRANQIARLLEKKALSPGQFVGIMTERSIEMVIGMLAILKTGAAYVPIDPNYPDDRINYMLDDASISILLTQTAFVDKFALGREIVDLEDQKNYKGRASNLKIVNQPRDLAYVMYTSGSTGKPKGVMIEHRNVVRLVKNTNYLPFDRTDRFLQTGAIVFDASTLEYWGTLLNGLRLYIVDENTILNPIKLGVALKENSITTLWLTSPLFNQLADQDPSLFKSLKYLLVGGDVLSPGHINRVRQTCPGLKIINGYGPTENTTFSLTYSIEGDFHDRIPIGVPISNSTAYVIGKNNELLPIGAWGELCVGGDGVGRGYLNQPELTEEKFVNDPFRRGAVMYRTGDLARWLRDGNIEFGGRIDQQVKIRGFRIELGEIESVVSKYRGIHEAVVIAREDSTGSKYLCGYYTAEQDISQEDIRNYLSDELPDYMIPSYFVQMDKFPLNTNGKVEKSALPEPERKDSRRESFSEPRNRIEKAIARIWEDVLEAGRVSIDDNFFMLGGQSLKASIVLTRIYKELNIDIPMKEIFQTPTIRELSEYIRTAESGKYHFIEALEKKETYPVSSAQKRQYVLSKLDQAGTGYNIPGAVTIEGIIDKDMLGLAVQKLVQRHEVFRTSFEMVEGSLIQRIHEEVKIQLEYLEAEEEQVMELIDEFIRPFDLSKAPLLRTRLVKIGENKYVFMFDMHHIISDGSSINVFMHDLVEFFSGEDLPPLRIQYRDFAAWQNELLQSEYKDEQEEFWLKSFEGDIPVLNLLTDYPRPLLQSFDGDTLKLEMRPEIVEGLNRLTKETGSTLFMVILSLFNVLLSKYSSQNDIIIGTSIAGRPHADLENLIGMFVNTLALRNHPSAEKTFHDFLLEVKENSLLAFQYQDYQFEELVEKLDIRRDMSRNPLFDAMFVMQHINEKTNDNEDGDMRITNFDFETGTTKFDLTLNAFGDNNQLYFVFEYCTRLFKRESIQRMSSHFAHLIDSVLLYPHKRISELEMLTPVEKEQILNEFNRTGAEYPGDKSIQQLFEEQVEKTPEAIAVEAGEEVISYRELNERANRLGRLLREKGVEKDTIAAIVVERSIEMIVGIYGILKAGGAYLPVDPHYPADRIEYLLSDSGAKVVLTLSKYKDLINSEIPVIDILSPDAQNYDKTNPDYRIDPVSLLYVIYTSGSTGKPKGVMIENYSLINRLNWMQRMYPIGPGDTILQKTPYTFDVSVWELFWWALQGAKVSMLEPGGEKYPELILKAIRRYQVTTMHFVPSMLGAFLEYIEDLSGPVPGKELKQVFASGEALTIQQVNKFNELLHKEHGTKLHNLYGPTEATIDVSYFSCSEGEVPVNVPIGKPIDNIRLYVMTGGMKGLMPIGIPGELCIGGDGLARGYLNRPDLTAEKFIENPFEPGKKMYRTGDLARWLPDGNIEFLGRIDFQVKIRGYRIELGEIENRLLSHESVNEVVVLAKEDENQNKFLCAYIVTEEELTVKQLRDYLSTYLPEYMVPAHFVSLDSIPLNRNGKIDRKALPDVLRNIDSGVEYLEPSNEVEEHLVNFLKEILGVEKISTLDNFFALGGDSIKALQLANLLMGRGLKLEIQDLFQNPIIKDLSSFVVPLSRIAFQGVVEGALGMIPIQKWFFSKKLAVPGHFNQALMLYNPKGFDEVGVKKIFEAITTHHDALRMVFPNENGDILPFNRGLEAPLFSLEIKDFRGMSDTDLLIREEANNLHGRINLETGPLVNLCLFRTDRGDHLLVVIHHLVIDGFSWRILMEDINSAYHQISRGEEIILPPKTDAYGLWAEKLSSGPDLKEFRRDIEYWSRYKGLEIDPIPVDIQKQTYYAKDSQTLNFELAEDETERLLKDSHKAYNTNVQDLLLTALGLSIKEWTGRDHVIIAMEGHGRENLFQDIDISRTVGWFTSLYPFVIDLSASENLPALIKTIKENFRNIPNKGMGYGVLKYSQANVDGSLVNEDLEPEICFNYLGQFDTDVDDSIIEISNLSSGEPIGPENQRFYALDFSAMIAEQKLQVSVTFNGESYLKENMQNLLNQMKGNLQKIIGHCLEQRDTEFTPGDFDARGLSMDEMENVMDKLMDKLNK
ncbi:MAG: amino acid adenylation domain-containing protein [Bacteroidales bacterium]|nr:amino acid adenylation domain-containing protein [Bacteroidales bacterium]